MYDKSFLGTSGARGIRNNNPGNLIKTSIKWAGKLPNSSDSRFEQFYSIALGARAMMKDIYSDITRKGQNTIYKLITAYAPPHENNTQAYITRVESITGIYKHKTLKGDLPTLKRLAEAMSLVENGKPIDPRFFETAGKIWDSSAAYAHLKNFQNGNGTPDPSNNQSASTASTTGINTKVLVPVLIIGGLGLILNMKK